jgi:branched-chain amino acid transport system ATP-binding protein
MDGPANITGEVCGHEVMARRWPEGAPVGGTPLLEVRDLSLRFGGIRTLSDVSVTVTKSEILSVIGPNGAGKTSLFTCISGAYIPGAGKILFEDRDITAVSSAGRAGLGIGRTFQNLALFGQMTVLENILVGRHRLMRGNLLTGAIYWAGGARTEEIVHRRAALAIMECLGITSVQHRPANTLPYGMRKRVELARAVAMEPKLLLLDEPMAGMNQQEKHVMAQHITAIARERGITVLMIEHDMAAVTRMSQPQDGGLCRHHDVEGAASNRGLLGDVHPRASRFCNSCSTT